MSDINCTIIIPATSRVRAKEIFETGASLFNVGMSYTGEVPFTHYMSSGFFLDNEFNIFCSDNLITYKLLSGNFNDAEVFTKTNLKVVNNVPEDYVNSDKPFKVESWAAKQIMSTTMPGICTGVETFIESIQDIGQKESAKASWYNAKYFERNNPLIAAIQSQTGLTDEQIDVMFLAAWNLVPVF